MLNIKRKFWNGKRKGGREGGQFLSTCLLSELYTNSTSFQAEAIFCLFLSNFFSVISKERTQSYLADLGLHGQGYEPLYDKQGLL